MPIYGARLPPYGGSCRADLSGIAWVSTAYRAQLDIRRGPKESLRHDTVQFTRDQGLQHKYGFDTVWPESTAGGVTLKPQQRSA